jgi:large subunit ribosomal protein L10
MPNAQKVERVAALKERIEGSTALLLTEYRGLTVAEIGELRRSLRESETSFAVIKNTLMARAATDAGMADLAAMLSGPSAVAFVHGDPVAAAKAIKAAAKLYPALVLKGGFMDGTVLDEAGATGLADLESREVMLSKIAGLLQGEMSRAAGAFVAAQSAFLSLLEAYKEKVPGEDAAAAEDAAEEPTAAAEEPAVAADEPAAEIEGAATAATSENGSTSEASSEDADTTDESTEEE